MSDSKINTEQINLVNYDYIIYTDGALRNYIQTNWRIGAWCYHLETKNQSKTEAKIEYNTNPQVPVTNNRMELTAVIQALQNCTNNANVILLTDSQYCLYGINNLSQRSNKDLWEQYNSVARNLQITAVHVYGHKGHFGNELVDLTMRDMLDNNQDRQNHAKK